MTRLSFSMTPTPAATELRLLEGTTPLPTAGWGLSGHPGVDLSQRWIVDGEAIEDEQALLVEHAAIARLTPAEALRLNLPAATSLRAVIEGSGIMVRPDFRVTLRWTRPGGQNVLGVERIGAWLKEASGWHRLPETLFAVADAVDAHTAVELADEAGRLRALAALRRALPTAAITGSAEASGLLGSVTVIEADALSLEIVGEGDAMQLVPVLHRAGADAAQLLPDDRQKAFGASQFHKWPTARAVYSLPGGVYVTISPTLRQALNVVRHAANGTPAERRAFLREPRAAIRAAIGDEVDAALVESLVVETAAWSERVIGLGLWQPRVLPWITLTTNEWFGPGSPATPRGLMIDR
jgi:hypothetical protein